MRLQASHPSHPFSGFFSFAIQVPSLVFFFTAYLLLIIVGIRLVARFRSLFHLSICINASRFFSTGWFRCSGSRVRLLSFEQVRRRRRGEGEDGEGGGRGRGTREGERIGMGGWGRRGMGRGTSFRSSLPSYVSLLDSHSSLCIPPSTYAHTCYPLPIVTGQNLSRFCVLA